MVSREAPKPQDDSAAADPTAAGATTTQKCNAIVTGSLVLRDAVPWPGSTYIIVDRALGRAVTLVDGALGLTDVESTAGNGRWLCVETSGWLGFRNVASGRYLGHDGQKRMLARATQHKGWEYFCARRHPDGGYLLLMTFWDGLLKMGISEGEEALVRTEDGQTTWEFIKVVS